MVFRPGHGGPDLAEQRIIQGVARADLEHRHAGVERELELVLVHHLGVDRQAGAARGLHENVERFVVALERVGIGARLPDPAAQDVGAGLLHRLRGLVEIVRVLRIDRALARR